jgi:hypothetical protein
MPKTARKPSLLQDVGAIAGLYVDIFRLMEKRATGHSLIIKYTPPDEWPDVSREEMAAREQEREAVHAGR